MLNVFSINQVKFVARTPTATDIKGRREQCASISSCAGTVKRSADSFCYLFAFIDEDIFATYASHYRTASYQRNRLIGEHDLLCLEIESLNGVRVCHDMIQCFHQSPDEFVNQSCPTTICMYQVGRGLFAILLPSLRRVILCPLII